jgi:RNA polymerase sigma-70 factor (ECF subfamily)
VANLTALYRLAPASETGVPDPRQDDYQLVQRLVAGDALAWRMFVERFERLVYSRVLATAREVDHSLPAADAEDLCAEVFAQLVAANCAVLRRFAGRSTLSTWLCVITRRIVLRRLMIARREPSRTTAPSELLLESVPGGAAGDPLENLIGGEDRELVAAGLAQLGERQRQLARLFYIDGCTYREISDRLQIPMNSIGPTLARIHDRLRAVLNGGENGHGKRD